MGAEAESSSSYTNEAGSFIWIMSPLSVTSRVGNWWIKCTCTVLLRSPKKLTKLCLMNRSIYSRQRRLVGTATSWNVEGYCEAVSRNLFSLMARRQLEEIYVQTRTNDFNCFLSSRENISRSLSEHLSRCSRLNQNSFILGQ